MRTPVGGDRSTQWVIQYRIPPVPGGGVTTWTRAELHPDETSNGPATRSLLDKARKAEPGFEWRAVRIEIVQRVEDW